MRKVWGYGFHGICLSRQMEPGKEVMQKPRLGRDLVGDGVGKRDGRWVVDGGGVVE